MITTHTNLTQVFFSGKMTENLPISGLCSGAQYLDSETTTDTVQVKCPLSRIELLFHGFFYIEIYVLIFCRNMRKLLLITISSQWLLVTQNWIHYLVRLPQIIFCKLRNLYNLSVCLAYGLILMGINQADNALSHLSLIMKVCHIYISVCWRNVMLVLKCHVII